MTKVFLIVAVALLVAATITVCRWFEWGLADFLINFGLAASIAISAYWLATFCLELWNLFHRHKIFVPQLEKLKQRFPDRAQIGLLAMGAAVALHALSYYRQQTTFAMITALEARDSATRLNYASGDGPDPIGRKLLRVFSDQPAIEVKSDGDCTPDVRIKIMTWEQQYFKKAANYDPGRWTDIIPLYERLWSSDEVLQPRSDTARVMVMHAIDYLYIAHDALHARDLRYFTDDEAGMWTAYLDDLTPSPFFLMALRDGQEYPYMMASVVEDIRNYYRGEDKAQIRCIVNTIYPEFLLNK